MGNILKFDLQESQCGTSFIGKAFFAIKYLWIAIIYPRLPFLAYQSRKLSYLYSNLFLKKNYSISFLTFRVYKRMLFSINASWNRLIRMCIVSGEKYWLTIILVRIYLFKKEKIVYFL